jgi:methionine sulfoxide reductase heme-binding subunit
MQSERVLWPWFAGVSLGLLALLLVTLRLAGPVPISDLMRPWYLSRGAGFVALGLLWLSVVVGLLQSCGLLKGLTSGAANIDLHDYVSVWSLYATLFHGLILTFDHYTALGTADVLVPFLTDYKPVQVALGIIALYLGVAATLTTYLRQKLSPAVWRVIHQLSLVGFFLALFHGLVLGTDSGLPAVAWFYRFAGISVGGLTLYRILLARSAARR